MDFSQYVKGNALEISYTTIDISELVSFLQSNAHITKLSLKNAGIGDKEAEASTKLSNLTSLCLWNNSIGDKGAEALAKLSNLTELDLAWNKIGDKGAEALANGDFSHLTLLGLSSNSILPLIIEDVLTSLEKRRNRGQDAANNQAACPDSQLGEVQPISRDQSLGSSRSSGSR